MVWVVMVLAAALFVLVHPWLTGRWGAVVRTVAWTLWLAELLLRLAQRPPPAVVVPWTFDSHDLPALRELPTPQELLSGPGRQPERVDGCWRLLFLGDSFTAGQGAGPGQDMPSQVGLRLADAPVTPEVLNHGIAGLSAWEEHALWTDHSQWWQPDVVVWGYVLNDLGVIDPLRHLQDAGLDVGATDGISQQPSGAGSLLWQTARGVAQSRQITAAMTDAYLQGHDPTFAREALDALTAAWREIGEPIRARGGRFVVVIWPILHQLDAYPFGAVHTTIAEAARASGAEVVDLLPTFAGRDARALWATPQDHHPNAEGYALAADTIAAALLAGAVQTTRPADCATVTLRGDDGLGQALCTTPSDPSLHLRLAERRLRLGEQGERRPFWARRLVAVHLNQAAAIAGDDPAVREAITRLAAEAR